ncbi:hypothetical protein [Nocardia sp. NPDC056000]|uniref:hypothetical protein n=1 Tax=Nocardia sp. NPDC056000 TaxID=3345674 RepID=UPI0035D8614A
MVSKHMVVTLSQDEWVVLGEAADAAGMDIEAYVSWCARIFVTRARPGGGKRADELPRSSARRNRPGPDDESESAAWAETFSERLSHRADRDIDS